MRFAISCIALMVVVLALCTDGTIRPVERTSQTRNDTMQLGNFSISLNVKDVKVSKEFYEKLGFKMSGGNLKQNYVVMQNETSTIGLYQGMFDKNMLTYNPGWDRDCKTLAEFQDVREIQQELKKRGLELQSVADENSDGPAYLTLEDPDGNPILLDQHVSRPAR